MYKLLARVSLVCVFVIYPMSKLLFTDTPILIKKFYRKKKERGLFSSYEGPIQLKLSKWTSATIVVFSSIIHKKVILHEKIEIYIIYLSMTNILKNIQYK